MKLTDFRPKMQRPNRLLLEKNQIKFVICSYIRIFAVENQRISVTGYEKSMRHGQDQRRHQPYPGHRPQQHPLHQAPPEHQEKRRLTN